MENDTRKPDKSSHTLTGAAYEGFKTNWADSVAVISSGLGQCLPFIIVLIIVLVALLGGWYLIGSLRG